MKRRSFIRSSGGLCLLVMSAGCSDVFGQQEENAINKEDSTVSLIVYNEAKSLKRIHMIVKSKEGSVIVNKSIALLGKGEETQQIAKIKTQKKNIKLDTIKITVDEKLTKTIEYSPKYNEDMDIGYEDMDIWIGKDEILYNYD